MYMCVRMCVRERQSCVSLYVRTPRILDQSIQKILEGN